MKKSLLFLIVCILILCGAAQAASVSDWSFDARKGVLKEYSGPSGAVTVPDAVNGVPVRAVEYGFSGRNDITSVAFPASIKRLGNSALNNIANLTSVTLSEGLQVLDYNCIIMLPALTELTVPASVTMVYYTVSWCENLRKITFLGECPAFVWPDFCFSVLPEDLVIYVPDDQLSAYRDAITTVDDAHIQPSGRNAVHVDYTASADELAFDAASGTILAYYGDSLRVDIPAAIGGTAVKAIGKNAFEGADLAYVTIPEGVEEVGASAFEGCNSLHVVKMPDSLKKIGDSAFRGIAGDTITWSQGLEEIGDSAFLYTDIGDELNLPESLRVIGIEAFKGASLRNAYIGGNIQSIGMGAFTRTNLNYLELNAYHMIEVGADAFAGTRLEDIDLPWDSEPENQQAWQALIDSQIEGCKVWINNPVDCSTPAHGSDSYESYPDGTLYLSAYAGDQSHLVLWHTMDGVQITGLGDGVFKGNQTLNTYRVTHSDQFTAIGAEAFAESAVETVDLYYTTETIGAEAFRNCVNLKEITLPASLKSIGEGAFVGCENLEKVTVNCDPKLLNLEMFAGCKRLDVAEVLGLEKMPFAANAESDFEFDAETGVITGYRGTAVDVVIPRAIGGVPVTGIGYHAFECARDYTDSDMASNQKDWLRLRSVVIPETVTEIADSAFSYCQQLELAVCYAPLQSTGRGTFFFCTGLENVIFVNGVDQIDNYCFDSCKALNNVYWGDHLHRIGVSAFVRSGLTSAVIDAEIVDEQAFYASNLWSVTLTDRVQEVHNAAFGACEQLAYFSCAFSEAERFVDGGPTGGIADTGVVTTFPAETTQEQLNALNRKFNVWNGGHIGNGNTITLGDVWYDLPVMTDVEALYAAVTAQPVYTPEPAAPAALPDPIGDVSSVLGTWKLALMVEDGVEIDPSLFGLEFVLTLNADGTGALVTDGEEALAWYTDAAGVMFIGSGAQDDIPVGFEDGRLVLAEGDGRMIFARDDGETPALPAAQPVVGGDAYVGVWQISKLVLEGAEYSAADFGLEMTLTLNADGTAVMVTDDEERLIWYVRDGVAYAGVGSDEDIPLVLDENGCLTLTEDGNVMVFARGEGAEPTPAPAPAPAPANDYGFAPVTGADDVLGDWVLYRMLMGETKLDPADFGVNMKLRFFEQGIVEVVTDVSQSRLWRIEDGLVYVGVGDENDLPVGLLDDGSLAMVEEDYTLLFKRKEAPVMPDDAAALAGEWLLDKAWMVNAYTMQSTEVEPALLGVSATMILKDDMTVQVTANGQQMSGTWRMTADGIAISQPGEEDTVATYEDGYLFLYEKGGAYDTRMRFARQEAEIASPAAPTDAPAPAPAPDAQSGGLLMEVKYVAQSFSSAGITMDASYLGAEYSIVLHADGSCDYVQAGGQFPGMTWKRTGDDTIVVDYMNGVFTYALTLNGGNLDLDFGGMIITYVPQS